MNSLKIFRLLSIISKEEWKDLEKFVCSPYFNKGRNFQPLLRILKEHHPDFDSPKLTKKFIYGKLYRGKSYNESVINTVFSGLGMLCEEYLLQVNFRENQQREIRLLKEYSKRGYELKAKGLCRSIEIEIADSPVSSKRFFENLDRIDAVQSHYAMNYDKEKRAGALNSGIKNLICFMMIQSFIFEKEIMLYGGRYTDSDFRNTLSGKLLSSIDFEKLLGIIEKEKDDSFVILKLYHLLVKQLSQIDDDGIFYEIKNILNQYRDILDDESVKKLFLNLVSICNMKNNIGKKEFMKEGYQIMKELSDTGFYDKLEESTHFPPSHFRNIVKAGIALDDLQWVEKFVRDNAHKLEHSQISALQNYSLAKIEFARRNFDRALEHLGKTDTENFIFKLDIRKLTAMIYYETDSFINLHSLLNAYFQIVTRKGKTNESILLRHKSFIKYLRKIEALKNGSKDLFALRSLQQSLKADNVSEKVWLSEKIMEIKKNFPGK